MSAPFIVYALPRSRTAWVSAFLTYRDWCCLHEPAVRLRHVSDIKEIFADRTGVVETAAAQAWPLIEHHVPGIRQVVIRRQTEQVVASMLATVADIGPIYDEARLWKVMAYGNRMLDQVAARPGTLVLDFEDLEHEEPCARLFEFCLPYRFDRDWWARWSEKNVQVSVREHLAYYHRNRWSITLFKRACKRELIRLRRSGLVMKGAS